MTSALNCCSSSFTSYLRIHTCRPGVTYIGCYKRTPTGIRCSWRESERLLWPDDKEVYSTHSTQVSQLFTVHWKIICNYFCTEKQITSASARRISTKTRGGGVQLKLFATHQGQHLRVSGKRDRQYFGRNFVRFRKLFIVFGMTIRVTEKW